MENKVEIYSTPTCPYCNMAKDYLKEKGVEYIEYNVADDQAKAQEMVEKSGQMGVPVIVVNGELMVGFQKDKIETLLAG